MNNDTLELLNLVDDGMTQIMLYNKLKRKDYDLYVRLGAMKGMARTVEDLEKADYLIRDTDNRLYKALGVK